MMLEFKIDKDYDPDGSNFRRSLQAHLACERMAAARSMIAHLLAGAGVAVWLENIWPDLFGSEIRFFVLAAFGAGLVLAMGVVIEEIACRVRLKHCWKANEGVNPEQTPDLD